MSNKKDNIIDEVFDKIVQIPHYPVQREDVDGTQDLIDVLSWAWSVTQQMNTPHMVQQNLEPRKIEEIKQKILKIAKISGISDQSIIGLSNPLTTGCGSGSPIPGIALTFGRKPE